MRNEVPDVDYYSYEPQMNIRDKIRFIAIFPVTLFFMFVVIPVLCLLAEIRWRILDR